MATISDEITGDLVFRLQHEAFEGYRVTPRTDAGRAYFREFIERHAESALIPYRDAYLKFMKPAGDAGLRVSIDCSIQPDTPTVIVECVIGEDRTPLSVRMPADDSVRYFVMNENTLGYVIGRTHRWFGVLAGSVIKGGHDPKNGPIWHGSQTLRPATRQDFEEYRVQAPSDLPE